MQYLIGALTTAAFFVCLAIAYIAGKRSRRPVVASNKETSREDRERAERLKKGFADLMSYDVTTAIGKKVP